MGEETVQVGVRKFDVSRFGTEDRIARFGGATADETAERLAWTEEILTGSDLVNRFEDVRFDLPLTLLLSGDENASDLALPLDRLRSPLRVSLGERERIVKNDDPNDAARAAELAAAVAVLYEDVSPDVKPPPVLVQEIAAARFGDRSYPHLSGLLLGENYYPVSYMKPEEGVACVALGLGSGNRAEKESLRFSPAYPELMPDFSLPADIVKNSQRRFLAVDHSASSPGAPVHFDLETAFDDGTLSPVGGVYSVENQMVYPGVHREGIKVVTFSRMLKGSGFPLAKILNGLHDLFREASPLPLAVRFAAVLKERRDKEGRHRFVIERVEAQRKPDVGEGLDADGLERMSSGAICTSTSTLGDGRFEGIRDILSVCPDRLDISRSHEIAREVGEWNEKLVAARRPYVLIGSGRWGTTDKYLGIPISWSQVTGARIQIEAGLEDFNIESSRGTHFFRELTFHEIGAMHVSLEKRGDSIDWEWLQRAPVESEGTFVRHLAFAEPLRVRIDGRAGLGFIRKPD